MAPMGAMICIGSNAGKSFNPKSNKIIWMKTRKNKPCDFALLLWISTRERIKRVGKLIEASVMRAYKNAHLSIGMVCTWEIGQMLWQEILKNKVIELNKLMRGNSRISTPTIVVSIRSDMISSKVGDSV